MKKFTFIFLSLFAVTALASTPPPPPPIFGGSLVQSGRNVTLVNDDVTPGASTCYSTNASGVKGWFSCSGGGGGSGTVTSISSSTGIVLTPNPIVTTGTIALAIPVAISSGGTNQTSQTSHGVNFFDGTHITSAAGFVYDGTLLSRLTSQLIIQSLGSGSSNANIGTTDTGATLVVGNVTGASSIVSTAFGLGNAVFGNAVSSGQVSSQGNGSIAAGYSTSSGIVATEQDGGIAVGRADTAGQVSANGVANQAFGYADGGAIVGSNGSGSIAFGYSTGTSSTINTTLGKFGQLAGGYSSGSANIAASGNGSFAYGEADALGAISASGDGSFAAGRSHGSAIQLSASGVGAAAFGYANSNSVTAIGDGSLAGGAPATGQVSASGTSSVAWGDANTSSGNLSLTTGLGNSNDTYAGIVGGRFAALSGQTATSWVGSDFGIVYGNGTSSGAKANAFSVTKNGTVTASIYLSANGAVGAPAHSFSSDTTSGLYLVGTGEMGLSIVGDQALDFQSDGAGDGNVGMGGPASLSPSYPLLIQRTNTSAGTFMQVSNPTATANANAAIQLATDSNNLGNIGVYTNASTVAPYIGAMIIRPNGDTAHLSLIGGDLTSGDVQVFTGGDYTATGETAVFNGDHTTTFFGPLKQNGSTSGVFTQKAAATTSSYTVTWPSAQTSGALSNNGSGTLSWTLFQTPLTFSSPLVNTAGTVTCNVASGSQAGCLASADWTTFNNKQSALTFSSPLVNTSGTISVTSGNLTDAGTDGIAVTGGTSAVLGSGTSIAQHVADTTHNGYLVAADWNAFNGKQSSLTFSSPLVNTLGTVSVTGSNLTDAGTDGIIVTGGSGAVLSTASLSQHVADATHNGYLSSTDWNTFATNSTPTFADSLVNTSGTVTLVNDSASPGASMCYSTNGSGVLGWNACSSGGGSGTVTSVSAGTGITLSPSPITTTGSVSLTVPVVFSSGGTNVTAVPTAASASNFAAWDANVNLPANAHNGALRSATSAGTITVASPHLQVYTGSTSATYTMPVATTLANGETFIVVNNSSNGAATVSVNSSGGTTLCQLGATGSTIGGGVAIAMLINSAGGTGGASWACWSLPFSSGNNLGTVGPQWPLAAGGTGVQSVTTTPTATAFAGWDAQKRMSGGAPFNCGFTTTATAAGTTTMTITSTCEQTWTGTTTQTIKLPTTNVKAGDWWEFYNLSTGTLALEASGAGAIVTQAAGAKLKCLALAATPTTAAGWSCL